MANKTLQGNKIAIIGGMGLDSPLESVESIWFGKFLVDKAKETVYNIVDQSVYAFMEDTCFETPAGVRMFKIGCDVVGMIDRSTLIEEPRTGEAKKC